MTMKMKIGVISLSHGIQLYESGRDPIHQSCRLCAFFWDCTSLPVRTYIIEARNVSESKLGEVDAEKLNDPYCNK